jgi:hypothetical protein
VHWVIQQSIFKPENYNRLVHALELSGTPYTSVSIKNGTYNMSPEVNVEGKVYVCGAIRMGKIARDKDWVPGSFLNENFNVARWRAVLAEELLNARCITGTLASVDPGDWPRFFIRPEEDNKAFDGMVIDCEMLADWRRDAARQHLQNLAVVISPVRQIYREYRLFVVNEEVVTGSVYKVGGRPHASPEVEDDVLAYARSVIARWTPAESFVVDIGLTEDGLKIIEFNNINSSGFYASDVAKYVDAINRHYG